MDVQHNCMAFMQEVLIFFSAAQAEQFMGVCEDLPAEDTYPSCVKNLKKPPTTISSMATMNLFIPSFKDNSTQIIQTAL